MHRIIGLAALAMSLAGVTPGSHAAFISYTATLSGPAEEPPNTSPGTGFAQVDFDTVAHTLRVRITFSGLTAGTTASHIHAPTTSPLAGTAGVATQAPTFFGFPLGVTSGTYDQTLNTLLASSYNPAYLTANGGTAASGEAALAAALASGRAYVNVHTSNFPAGEIRGFLQPAAVPEPASLLMVGLGMIGLVGYGRHRRSMGRGRVVGGRP